MSGVKRYRLTTEIPLSEDGDLKLPMAIAQLLGEKAPWALLTWMRLAHEASKGKPGPFTLKEVVDLVTNGTPSEIWTPDRVEMELGRLAELKLVEVTFLN